MSSLWQSVKDEITYQLAQFRPFIALAGTQTTGRMAIRRVTEATAGTEQYARLAGFNAVVDDEIVCLIVGGKPLVLGKLQRTAAGSFVVHTQHSSGFVISTPNGGYILLKFDSAAYIMDLRYGTYFRIYSDAGTTLQFQVANGNVTISGALDHDGTTVGLFGVTPAVRPAAYTVTNLTTDRTYDADLSSTADLADVLGTLIADLRTLGIVQ